MPDPRDQLDLTIHPAPASAARPGDMAHDPAGPDDAAARGRPWLSLWFTCANTYTRAYRNAAGTGYEGRCPKCGKSIRFMIGPGGTNQRTFQVSC